METNLNNVSVSEEKDDGLTDLQLYGIHTSVVKLLSKIRKYSILIQIQMDLLNKSHQIQPIMREIYQFEETKMIMDIREEFDMFYVFTKDKIVVKNVEIIRNKFEQAINFVTTNMQTVESILDKNYLEILDTFADRLKLITNDISSKSIFDEHFKLS